MQIKLSDKYEIQTTKHCFILNRLYKAGENAQQPGESMTEPVGYYSSLDGLLKALPDRVMQRSETTNIKDALGEVRALIKAIKKNVEKGAA